MDEYESELIKALERRGFCVDWFKGAAKIDKRDLSLNQRLLRVFVEDLNMILLKYILDKIEQKIYKKRVDNLRDHYDIVFDFAGKARTNCLRLLREKYSCEFVLYLWDDLRHHSRAKDNFIFFNKVYTFSKSDAEKYNLLFRPNFFLSKFLYQNQVKVIDVFYRGTLRDRQRSRAINCLINVLCEHEIDVSLLVKGGYLRNFSKVTSREFFKMHCTSKRLSGLEMAEKSKRAKVLLDIAFDNQNGLGLRPIEALAANCKLVTTNNNIIDYEIYNTSNTFILRKDFSNIEELEIFFAIPYKVPNGKTLHKYSVEGFIDEIFRDLISSIAPTSSKTYPTLE